MLKNIKNLPIKIGASGVRMNILSFAIRSMSRNPRRTFTLIFSIILPLILLIGTFLTVEYLGQEFMAEVLKDIGVDIRAGAHDVDISGYMDVLKDLEKIDGIENVEAVVSEDLWGYNISKDGKLLWPQYRRVSENFTIRVEPYEIYVLGLRQNLSGKEIIIESGKLNLAKGNVAITEKLADELKLKPGDNITLTRISYIYENETRIEEIKKVNATISAIIRFEGRLKSAINKTYEPYQGFLFITSIEFAKTFLWIFEKHSYIEYWVFINYDKVLNPWNMDQTIKNLRKIEIKIESTLNKYYSYNFHIVNWLLFKLEELKERTEYLKFGFGLTILPIMLMAFFFTLTANQILIFRRRREIGLLKVRGATNKQLFLSMLVESFIIGGVGGILGATAGYLTSMQLVKIFLEKTTLPVKHVINKFLPFYFQLGIGLGIIVSVLATYIPARKILKMRVQGLLEEYLEELEPQIKMSKKTKIFFLLGLLKVLETFLNISVAGIISGMTEPKNFAVFLILTVIFFVDLLLNPLGPIFFIYGLIKIVTYYSVKLQIFFKSIVKPFLKDLSDIAVKNFSRKPVRTLKVMFLVSTVLVYGVAIVTIPSLERHRARILAEIECGADVSFQAGLIYNETEFMENISKIEGIKLVSRAIIMEFRLEEIGRWTTLYIVDENYFNVSHIRNVYLEGITVKEAYNNFKSGENYCLISRFLRDEYGYKVGEKLNITAVTSENLTVNLELQVVGVLKVLPGLESIYRMRRDPIIVTSFGYLQKSSALQKLAEEPESRYYFIDLSENANNTEVIANLKKRYEVGLITSLDQTVQKYLNDPLIEVFSISYCNIEFFFALIIGTTNLSLIIVSSVLEREREIALLVVRGMSRKQVIKTVFGETLLMILIALLLGLTGGFSSAYGFYLLSIPPEMVAFFIKSPISISLRPYVFIGLGLIVFLAASLLSAWYATRRNLAKMLRICH